MIVAPETSLVGGAELAEGVRQLVGAAAHPAVGSLTISAGVAAWPRGMPVEQALRLADQALYLAKANGRNRVETAGDRSSLTSGDGRIVA